MLNLLYRVWLSIAVSALLLLPAVTSHAQQAASTVEGVLQVVWGDPHPQQSTGGEIRYSLTTANGAILALDMTGRENVAASYFGKLVTVSGRMASSNSGTTNSSQPSTLLVDSIQLSKAPQPNPSVTVSGTKKVIYLLVKFSDDAAVPHVPGFYTDLNNPDTPPGGEVFPATVNGFFKKTSGNVFSWLGDVGGVGGVGASGGWLTLPQPKSYYANCGWSSSCAQLQTLGNDATALGRAQGINFLNYDNINFVLSNDLDCCAWGGGYYSSVDAKSYGATWEPPWGQETGTYAHEMGHSIGLPHSGWVYSAYDSPWDIMSNRTAASNISCGSYLSKNSSGASSTIYCSEPGDGYNASYKEYLGWIPFANTVVVNPGSATTVTLEGSSLPIGASAKIIKVGIPGYLFTGATARYFTVEARVGALGTSSQYDNGLAGEGIIIHEFRTDRPAISGPCFFNNQSGWALPIDATPGDYDSGACNSGGRSYPNYALNNAQWGVGQTYTNNTYGFSVSVVSRSGSSFVVSVQNGVSPPSPPTIAGILAGPGQATISFTAPTSTGGSPIVSYTASCSAPSNPTVSVTGSGSPLVVTGLVGGVAYSCSVTASNGSYSSVASAVLSVTPVGSISLDITPLLMLLLLDQ